MVTVITKLLVTKLAVSGTGPLLEELQEDMFFGVSKPAKGVTLSH
jgi:hypothetical protein